MHQPPTSPQLELLAPAGSVDAFFAALENGADAVYCGLQEFSARAKAKNFSLTDGERLCSHAHREGKKLYIALNTLIKEQELPRLIEILASLAMARVDGIIIQDLGVYRLARRFFPELSLHGSTQMTIHNVAGVQMLERMGFTRVVLARELSLEEITEIRSKTSLELEHFVHGALCYSISGQCLFSSTLSGASGNRGRCAQPCRRRFLHGEKPGYYFSTSDLCAIDKLAELRQAGITSFKIEGRMRSAEYVARTVAAYRLMLDAPPAKHQEALAKAREHLALSFGRESTRGFLGGYPAAGLSRSAAHGSMGKSIGRISAVRSGELAMIVQERLHVGDRLRIVPDNDRSALGFTVRELRVRGKTVRAAKPGDHVLTSLPANLLKKMKGQVPLRKGDLVFQAGGRQSFTRSPAACAEQLAAVSPSRRMEEECDAILDRAALAGKSLPSRGNTTKPDQVELTLSGCSPADLDLLRNDQAAFFEFPLTPEQLIAAGKLLSRLSRWQKRLIWALPPMLFGKQWEEYRRAVQILAGQGFTLFRVSNLGHLPLFSGLDTVQLLGDFRCYTMNSQAALAWLDLGLSELTVNLEDERGNVETLLRLEPALPLSMIVHGPVPLLLSRVPRRDLRPGALLQPEQENGFRLLVWDGISELRYEEDFSLLGSLAALREIGCARMRMDLSRCGCSSKQGRKLLAAWREDRNIPSTCRLNFDRGLI